MSVMKRLKRKLAVKKPAKRAVVNDVLIARATEDAARFIEAHLAEAMLYRRKDEIRHYAIERAPKEGLMIEFGVLNGEGINFFADRMAAKGDTRPIYGFDAFRGLSEDWYGKSILAGTKFDRKGVAPPVRDQVELVIGWIDETIGPFLEAHTGPVAFAHFDFDTYTPSRVALEAIRTRLRPGTLLSFDEHHAFPNWRNGEFKAIGEVLSPEEYIYRAFSPQGAVIEITRDLS